MAISPTCCIPLTGALRATAILDMFISIVAFVASAGGFVYFELYQEKVLDIFQNPPPELSAFLNLRKFGADVLRIFLAFNAVYWIQKLALGIVLVVAAIKRSLYLLRIWLVYTLILLCFSVLFFLAAIFLGVAEPYSIPFYVGMFLVREYTMLVVSTTLKRLQNGQDPDDNSQCEILSDDKVMYKL